MKAFTLDALRHLDALDFKEAEHRAAKLMLPEMHRWASQPNELDRRMRKLVAEQLEIVKREWNRS